MYSGTPQQTSAGRSAAASWAVSSGDTPRCPTMSTLRRAASTGHRRYRGFPTLPDNQREDPMNVLRSRAPRKVQSPAGGLSAGWPVRRWSGRLLALLAPLALIAASLLGSAGTARASDYTTSNVPDWAIRPFTRSVQNPLLS